MANEHQPPPFDIPPGFEAELQELGQLLDLVQTSSAATRSAATRRQAMLIDSMLRRLEPGQFLSFQAFLYDLLGGILAEAAWGDRRANLKAIASYEQAL